MMRLANLYNKDNLWDKGIQVLKNVIKIDENNFKSFNSLAFFHYQKGLYNEGINYLKIAIKISN